jgi:synaptobrevin family protein YKT6
VAELCRFIARQLTNHVASTQMASFDHQGYTGHVLKQWNGLAAVVITKGDYPSRAAHGVIRRVLTQFEKEVNEETWKGASDDEVEWKPLAGFVKDFQEPKPDKIQEIELEIENTTKIAMQNIEKVLGNMEKLDRLVENSRDLAEQTRLFYKGARKLNRCCTVL